MRRTVQTAFLVLAVAMGVAASSGEQKQTPKSEKQASMTGCVDEQEGHYVLIDERGRNPIADLEADGFPVEGFAKHVGHKVIVRGMSNAGDKLPRFKVRTVETVSETCAPSEKQGRP